MTMQNENILSSLPLQIFLYFNGHFTRLWLFLNLTIFCWKAHRLYYTTSAFWWEVTMVLLLSTMDFCRIRLATRGNKTEQFAPLIWSVGLAAPTAVGYVFFLNLQTYVLHVDRWLNVIPLVFLSLELAFSLIALFIFHRAYQFAYLPRKS